MPCPMAKERLQKILARAGLASSRRKAEELILEGSITINGQPAKLGASAELGTDAIKVRGKLLQVPAANITYAFYKPRGMIAALSDPEKRPTIAPFLADLKERLFPVERLDFNGDGLIFLTNDGSLQERLQKQSQKVPRSYHVKVRGHINAELLDRLERGAKIEERYVKPKLVRQHEELGAKSIVEIAFLGVPGGIDIKGYFEMKGFLVERVTRVGIGHITLRGMVPGEMRPLEASQVDALFTQPELFFQKIDHQTRETKAKGRDVRGLKPPPRSIESRGIKIGASSITLPKPNRGGGSAGASAASRATVPRPRGRMPELFEGAKPASRATRPGSRPGTRPDSRAGTRSGARPGARPGSRPGSRPAAFSGGKPGPRSGAGAKPSLASRFKVKRRET